LVSYSKPAPFALTSFTTSRSTPFVCHLRAAFVSTSVVSAAKPTIDLTFVRAERRGRAKMSTAGSKWSSAVRHDAS
jgi:hypothetical protein